jgi:hypothetical protein
MLRIWTMAVLCAAGLSMAPSVSTAQPNLPPSSQYQTTSQAFGRQWGRTYSTQDWQRFNHYPYVYYPQNFWGEDYYRSSESLYYRYPPEMRIPVYNKKWQNYYPQSRKYHQGNHFILDVF